MPTYLLFTILGLLVIILIILIFKLNRNKEEFALKSVYEELSRLYEKIGSLDRDSREVLELSRSFHDILKPTKTRGIVGEAILENLLKDILPQDVVVSQYAFKDGRKVDFAVKLSAAIVPIDSKFSLETFKNYLESREPNKDRQRRICIDGIKKRIIESAAYIYPDEGTTDFSLMYVPSEAVYYFIITETTLLEFAQEKKVFIVGPNTLYAYLKTILIGFKAMKIEKQAKQIYNGLKRLEKDILLFMREYEILGSHIRSASSKYEDAAKRIENVSFKLHVIGSSGDDNKGASSSKS